MADVFGTIGREQVELNNAATEATLKLLLQTTIAMAKGNKEEINKIATKAGLDPEAVQRANTALRPLGSAARDLGSAFNVVRKNLSTLGSQFVEGTAQTSNVFQAFSALPGLLGVFANGLAMVARFQEANLKTYREISSVGANFGGSLTQMRQAAANTYMTLDQFGAVVKKNGEALSMLGGGTNEGIQSFARLSKSLMSSPLGTQLLSLGYSTQEVNDGMLNYIAMTGGRTKAELSTAEGVKKVAQASGEYLEQLNGLAELTGKSRQQQQDELAQASKNAAFQSYLQTLDEESRKKAVAGMANAMATGGKGAVDAFQSKLMGVAPDKAGALFIATAGETANIIDKSAAAVADKNKKVADMNAYVAEGFRAAQRDMSKFSEEGLFAIIRQGGPLAESLQQLGITANKAATMTDEEIKTILDKKVLADSEAKQMVEAEKSLKEFTQALIGLINPIVTLLTPVLKFVAGLFGGFGNWLNSLSNSGKMVVSVMTALVGVTAAYLLLKKREAAGEGLSKLIPIGAAGGGAGGGIGAGMGAALQGLAGGLKAVANPMALVGLGALTLAVMGLAQAFKIASVGFEPFGKMIESFGKSVKSAFEGIAVVFTSLTSVITSIGNTIVTVFNGLADGILKLQTANPIKILSIGGAIGTLGVGLAPFSLFGGIASLSINTLADGLLKIQTVDAEKLKKVAEGMQKINEATPTVGQTLRAGLSNIVSRVTGGETAPAAGAAGAGPAAGAAQSTNEMILITNELKRLNNVSSDILRNMRDAVDQMRRNVDATRSLSGNLFPTP